jgi:hypothetical protein
VIQPADRSLRLQDDLRLAADRLKKRCAGRVEDHVVDGVVATLAGEFAGARVTDFVGLLVERRGAHMLESMRVTA